MRLVSVYNIIITSDNEGYVFTLFVCLFVFWQDYAKLLNRVSKKSVQMWYMGHGITH